jgi:hypothetical protein
MLYMVDTTVVAAGDTDRFLTAFESTFLPAANERGMELVACWHTPTSLGEDVDVMAIFRLKDWAHWNELRRKAVLDPAMLEWIEVLESLRRGGSRKFFAPATFSPLP